MQLSIKEVKNHINSNSRLNWNKCELSSPSFEYNVKRVRFAYRNRHSMEGHEQPSTNDWCILLEVSENYSVRVDVIVEPELSHYPGIIFLKDHNMTKSIHDIISTVPENTKVADILSVLIVKKRDRYLFPAGSRDCRYWIHTFAGDLAQSGLISGQIAQQVQVDLQIFPSDQEERVMPKGIFY